MIPLRRLDIPKRVTDADEVITFSKPKRQGASMTMTSGTKGLVGFFTLIAGTVALIAWVDDVPSSTTRWVQAISTILTVLGVVCLFLPAPKNLAPDFLFDFMKDREHGILEKNEFCFTFTTSVRKGVFFVHTIFQNQRDSRCVAQIAMHPQDHYFGEKGGCLTFVIDCAPGAFGISSIPVGVAPKFRDDVLLMEIGVSIERPEELGDWVRFDNGIFVRADANLGDGFGTALQIAGAVGGALVTKGYTQVSLEIAEKVRSKLPEGAKPSVETLWRIGDPEDISLDAVFSKSRAGMSILPSRNNYLTALEEA